MNPDGSPRALCAAPAGPDDDHVNWYEWHAAPPPAAAVPPAAAAVAPRVILNPEDEDGNDEESRPPSPVYAPEEEAPVPPIVEPVEPPPSPWTEWTSVPDRTGPFTRFTPNCVREWRFKFANPDAPQQRLVIQARLFGGDTETHIVPLEQLKLVKAKHSDYHDNYAVHLDLSKWTPRGVWSPGYIRLTFTKQENALAFQEALVDYLALA
jgi:hypothetical protein